MNARAAIVVLGWTLLAACGGCGRGETYPLTAPGGTGESPADPRWRAVNPVDEEQTMLGVAWRPGDTRQDTRAVIVGSRGLLLQFDGQRWHRRRLDAPLTLRSAAVGPEGRFWAVGDGGVILCEDGGAWRPDPSGTAFPLDRIGLHGGRLHATGPAGTVLRREADGWRDLSLPDTVAVRSLVDLGDSLLVADGDGALWCRTGGRWAPLAQRPWGDETAVGLAVAAGQLYALADSLYRREISGWTAVPIADWFPPSTLRRRLHAAGDLLWGISSWFGFHLDIRDPDGTYDIYYSGSPVDHGVAGTPRALVIGTDLSIAWYDEPDGTTFDPAGRLWNATWLGFAQGDGLISWRSGLLAVSSRGLEHWAPPPLDGDGDGITIQAVLGRDGGDFFACGLRSLHRFRGGQWSLVDEWDEGISTSGLERDSLGRLVRSSNSGVDVWNGQTWDRLLGEGTSFGPYFHLHRGAAGALLSWDDRGGVYLERDGEWILLRRFWDVYTVLQRASGEILVFGIDEDEFSGVKYNMIAVTRPGLGRFGYIKDADTGAIRDLHLVGGSDRHGEILVWTADPTMVFRLTWLAGVADWEPATGLLPVHAETIERRIDGSLVAFDESHGRVYVHHQP